MYYNRILSARLKGLKKEMPLKNRQQTKKKSLYTISQLNFDRQAFSYFSLFLLKNVGSVTPLKVMLSSVNWDIIFFLN